MQKKSMSKKQTKVPLKESSELEPTGLPRIRGFACTRGSPVAVCLGSNKIFGNWQGDTMEYCGVAVHQNSIYVVAAGYDHSVCARFDYSPDTGFKRTNLPNLTNGRRLSAAALLDGKYLYHIGGLDYGESFVCARKLFLTKQDLGWVCLPNLNEKVGCCAICTFDSRFFYRVGGYTGGFGVYSDRIERLDTFEEDRGWSFLPLVCTMGKPWPKREIPGCVQRSPSSLFIFGGRDFSNNDYVTHTDCFFLDARTGETEDRGEHLDAPVCFGNSAPGEMIRGVMACVDTENSDLKLVRVDLVQHRHRVQRVP